MVNSDPGSSAGLKSSANIPTLRQYSEAKQVDLVFILDTICSSGIFRVRQNYIKNLLNAVKTNFPPGGRLRLGAIAYRASKRASKDPNSFEGFQLSDSTGDVMNFLKAKRPTEGRNFEAAVEEALEALYRFGWARASRRFVVAVGSRPPHPLIREPYCVGQLPSPPKYDWRVLLTGLRNYYRLNFISVVCPIYWPADDQPDYAEEYAVNCWREIGYTATFKFNPANYAAVAGLITKSPYGNCPSSPEDK
jgi:hypothetical protein